MALMYSLKYDGIDSVLSAFRKYGQRVEDEVGAVVQNDIPRIVEQKIKHRMPISNRRRKNARYAKTSKSIAHRSLDKLGVVIETTPSFGYLVFPEEGRGRSNPRAQQFFKGGIEASQDAIRERIERAVARATAK